MITFAGSGVRLGGLRPGGAARPMFAPTGLNAWARFSRWVALSSGPIAIANGLADVSRIDRPAARTNSAARNGANANSLLAGRNRRPPSVARPSPVRTPALYPNRRLIIAAGMASEKYAP